MSQVFILRHGERADRAPTRRNYPVSFDPCLTELGLQQAEKSSEKILEMIEPGKSVHIVSSPFLRCLETAGKLAEKLNTNVHMEEGFGEFLLTCDFSECPFDSLTYKRLGKGQLETSIGVTLTENQHVVRPKFPENFQSVKHRVEKAWSTYLSKVQEDVLVVVTHLFILESLTELLLGKHFSVTEEGYCRLTYAEFDGTNFEVKLCGDFSHVPQRLN